MATSVAINLHVQGLDKLLDKLNAEKGGTAAKAALRSGLRAGANLMLKAAKARAPVDTGLLQKSLKVIAMKRSRKAKGRIGLIIGTNSKNNLFVGKTFYAGMQEYGTSKMPARPFMRPAFDATKDAAIEVIKTKVATEVEKRLGAK